MAVTKIHPIKTTLKKAIDYICNGDKTNDEIYVTTHLCSRENAHKKFELTKKQFNSRTKTLAHHLIQSFVPEEVSFEEAHQVGIELCDKILDGKYEYVLATHIDKDHIHNHIIFNSIDVDEGKVYHSYYGSYMNIRNQSDKLCKEHNLSVIDQETQKEINEIKQRKFVNWYDWNEDKKGKSYKSRLQFDMDRVIQKAINWEHFLKIMEQYGYEIKFEKYIAFKQKNQQRFTRAKTIMDNYTEEKIKEGFDVFVHFLGQKHPGQLLERDAGKHIFTHGLIGFEQHLTFTLAHNTAYSPLAAPPLIPNSGAQRRFS